MSGYPYGNTGGGYPPPYGTNSNSYPSPYGMNNDGYPPSYGMNNNGYPNYPPNNNFQPAPPAPAYGNNPSFGFPYETTASARPSNNNYSAPVYGVHQIPNSSYGYPTVPLYGEQMPPPIFNPPPQQYEGFGNVQQPTAYPAVAPSPLPGGLYPHLQTSTASTNYSTETGTVSTHQSQYQQQSFFPQEQSSTSLTSLEQYQGTVFPISNFQVEADCRALSEAMKGFGTNERALIDIIVNRSNAQRQQIKIHYKTMYGIDLPKQLIGELSGNFRETITALFETPANFDAWSLQRALDDGKEGTLSEILLTKTNSEIRVILEAYRRTYNKDLEKEITNRVRGTDFRRILVSAIQANRDELSPQQIQQARQMGIESVIDRNRARQDADDLYKAGAGKWGTDEKAFNVVFAQRNYYQLRATFEEYQKKHRQDMAQVIRSEFSGDIKDAYLALIACIRDRSSFFAERLHKAISGLGTTDRTLIRIIVTRAEIDLAQIKQRYQQMYKHSLAEDVSGDTSGDYKRILLAIVK